MGGHGGGGCTHITCINMPIQNKYHRIVAHVSSVQNLYYVATVQAQSSGLCLTFGAVLHTWNYLCFIIWIYTVFRTKLNAIKEIDAGPYTLELAVWSSFCPELMESQVALTGNTGHVQVFL